MNNNSKRKVLRQLIARPGLLVVPGVGDAFGARLVEEAGHEAVAASGYCINLLMGLTDTGVSTMSEMAERVGLISRAVDIPCIADADSGYGTPLNVMQTIREFERAGVAGLHLEDQKLPKRCGQLPGTRFVSKAEALGKLHAALDARTDPDLVIIARTDTLVGMAKDGTPGCIELAIERLQAYAEAGADVVFVVMHRGPEMVNQINAITAVVDKPLMVDIQEHGPHPGSGLADVHNTDLKIAVVPTLLQFFTPLKAIRRAAKIMKDSGLAGVEQLFNENDPNEVGLAFTGITEMGELAERYSEEAWIDHTG